MTEDNSGKQSKRSEGGGITAAVLLIAVLLTGYCVAKDCERPSLAASHVAAVQSVLYPPTASLPTSNEARIAAR
jgi:hypothetical protein